jgi:PAS domain S-box-containing protein
MKKNSDVTSDTAELRRRAELRLNQKQAAGPAADADTRKLLHELQVHQIELEMQNEELRQARTDAETALQQYTELFDFAPVGYFTLDLDGIISQVNLAGAKLLGLERRKLIGRHLGSFFDDKHRLALTGFLHRVFLSKVKARCELSLSSNGSTPRFVDIEGITDASEKNCRVVVFDITERKQFEQVQQDYNVELKSARAAADKANLAKSEFLSCMSHELRTPLNAVLGFGQLLASAKSPPSVEQKLQIDQILKAGWYLLHLINEILDLAMIESGKVRLSQEELLLTEVMKDCQGIIETQALKRSIQMTFPPVDKLCYVLADRTRLKQVIINLLSNAIKYNRDGGEVIVQYAMSGENRLRISVKDTGVGLAPEQLEALFQPFNRLGQETSIEEGTGIGLVVTKQLVELMGGSIGVDSRVGVGSVFWIELAVASVPVLAIGRVDADQRDHRAMVHATSNQRTLLYVEDNPANLLLVEHLIALRSDFKLLTAIDGYLGIQVARVYQPDVILMDINLPYVSGYQALKILRQDALTAHIPVLALSGNAMPGDIKQGLEAGFFCYLTKPIKIDEFMEALDAALRHVTENGVLSQEMAE